MLTRSHRCCGKNVRTLLMPVLGLGTSLVFGCSADFSAPEPPSRAVFSIASSEDVIPGRYTVVLRNDLRFPVADREALAQLVRKPIRHRYERLFAGFTVELDSAEIDVLRKDRRVVSILPDYRIHEAETDYSAGWALGRIDQRFGPSDYQFTASLAGQEYVNIYILDSGIDGSHPDFAGRIHAGWTFNSSYLALQDCRGHGTAVASVAGGAEYGVAKGAQIWSVRATDCDEPSRSDVIAGLEWLMVNHIKPAVLNLSWVMSAFWDGILAGSVHNAAQQLRAQGVLVVVAAGNDNNDACGRSPANAESVLTVAATDAANQRASFSNFGPCVDLFAPGDAVQVALVGGGHGFASGTSMAAPFVAGVGALYFAKYRFDTMEFAQTSIMDGASVGRVTDPRGQNLFLYSNIPAPVEVTNSGPDVLPQGTFCTWYALTKAGYPPITLQWSGLLSGSSSSVSGQLYDSGYLWVDAWDGLGNHVNTYKLITVDPSLPPTITC